MATYSAEYAPAVKRRSPALRIILWLLGALCAFAAVMVGLGIFNDQFGDGPPRALNGYMDGKGYFYEPPGEHYSVRLPELPQLEQTPVPGVGFRMTMNIASVEHRTYVIAAFSYDTPFGLEGVDEDVVLRAGIQGGANAISKDVTLSAPTRGTVAGFTSYSAHGEKDGSEVYVTFLNANGRLYGFFVATTRGADEVLHELEESFEAK